MRETEGGEGREREGRGERGRGGRLRGGEGERGRGGREGEGRGGREMFIKTCPHSLQDGGWSSHDAERFHHIMGQYPTTLPWRRTLLIDRLMREFPHKTRSDIVSETAGLSQARNRCPDYSVLITVLIPLSPL